MNGILYSWILPVKNEADSLPQLIKEIVAIMQGKNYEIIAVNDASTDKTRQVLSKLKVKSQKLIVIDSKKHIGKWLALHKGFKEASGDVIITSDSDLQDNPKEVKKLIAKLNQGYDVVSGERRKRQDSWYKIAISKLGNWLVSKALNKKFEDINSPFKVYRKEVINRLPFHGTLLRFSMLFAYKQGFRAVEVPVIHRIRLYGKSKFGIVKYLRILYDLTLILLLFSGSGRITRFRNDTS